jgi:hypothetical protein
MQPQTRDCIYACMSHMPENPPLSGNCKTQWMDYRLQRSSRQVHFAESRISSPPEVAKVSSLSKKVL